MVIFASLITSPHTAASHASLDMLAGFGPGRASRECIRHSTWPGPGEPGVASESFTASPDQLSPRMGGWRGARVPRFARPSVLDSTGPALRVPRFARPGPTPGGATFEVLAFPAWESGLLGPCVD